jgi:hypothetical protein
VWDTADGASISVSGDRYVFAYQPSATVTSTNGTKTYGTDASTQIQADYSISLQPAVTGAYLADQASAVYTGAPSMASAGSTVTATVAGGPYTITGAIGSLVMNDGYGMPVFTNTGHLTVTQAPLTITAASQSATYGVPYTLSTASGTGYTETGLLNADTITGLTEKIPGNLSATTTATSVGTYTITPSAATGSGLSNYSITYLTGLLTVNPAVVTTALTYVVANASSIYGTLAVLGGATLTGILNNDQVLATVGAFTVGGNMPVTLAYNTGAGTYIEKVTGLTGAQASNYVIAGSGNTNGTLTIGRLPVTLSGSKTYDGSNDAPATLTITDLVAGDSALSVGLSGTGVMASANHGTEALTLTGGTLSGLSVTSPNYTVVGGSGTISVNPQAAKSTTAPRRLPAATCPPRTSRKATC